MILSKEEGERSTNLQTAVGKLLTNPETFKDGTTTVQLKETHISLIFITNQFVYKLKKPVKFDFLDFSTFDKRLEACRQEVLLNKRMAPDTYLGVYYVVKNKAGALQLDEGGERVEPLVKMRRLPSQYMLDQLILNDQLTASQLKSLAEYLTHYYSNQRPFPIKAAEYVNNFYAHIRSNRAVLLDNSKSSYHDRIKYLHTAQLMFLHFEENLLCKRVAEHHVIDGHGDLRPEHICLAAPIPAIFDCIEFNQDYRTIDVIDELAFLAMECEALGDEECGNYILHQYKLQAKDLVDSRLIEFYKAYRACVRAKVAALRSQQDGSSKVSSGEVPATAPKLTLEHYINIALRHAAQLDPRWLFTVGGGMGTGKTTLAQAIAEKFGSLVLSADAIRREIWGESITNERFNEGRYAADSRQAVYGELFKRLETALDSGLLPVLDASFMSHENRNQLKKIAWNRGLKLQLIWCVCPPALAKKRIKHRIVAGLSISDARPDLVESFLQEGTPPVEADVLVIDTTQTLADELSSLRSQLRNSYICPVAHDYPPIKGFATRKGDTGTIFGTDSA